MPSPLSFSTYASSFGRLYLPVALLKVAVYSLLSLSFTFTTSRCKSARTLSVTALAAMLSIPTYCVESDVTGRLNFEDVVVDASPN